MISKDEIKKLGELARIEISGDEIKTIENDLNKILDFVSKLKSSEVQFLGEVEPHSLHPVLREDAEPHKPGKYSEDLLKQAPEIKNGYVKVKKVL